MARSVDGENTEAEKRRGGESDGTPTAFGTAAVEDERTSSSTTSPTPLNEQGVPGRVDLADKGGVSKDRLAFEELGTREVDRLFSTLEPCDVSGFRHKPGSLLDATALIGGTAVGAGILALPAATLQAGLIPSSVALVLM